METVHIVFNDAPLGVEGIHDDELKAELLEELERTMRIRFISGGENFINHHQPECVCFTVRAKKAVLSGDGRREDGESQLGLFRPLDFPEEAEK